jgi:hypothetical protein
MKVTIWHEKGFDVASCSDYFNYFCMLDDLSGKIEKTKINVGIFTFIPGEKYSRFGSSKKTSAGWIFYKGEALQYVGRYKDYMLFSRDGKPMKLENYQGIYFCWQIMKDVDCLFAINESGSGRVMEMNSL